MASQLDSDHTDRDVWLCEQMFNNMFARKMAFTCLATAQKKLSYKERLGTLSEILECLPPILSGDSKGKELDRDAVAKPLIDMMQGSAHNLLTNHYFEDLDPSHPQGISHTEPGEWRHHWWWADNDVIEWYHLADLTRWDARFR